MFGSDWLLICISQLLLQTMLAYLKKKPKSADKLFSTKIEVIHKPKIEWFLKSNRIKRPSNRLKPYSLRGRYAMRSFQFLNI